MMTYHEQTSKKIDFDIWVVMSYGYTGDKICDRVTLEPAAGLLKAN